MKNAIVKKGTAGKSGRADKFDRKYRRFMREYIRADDIRESFFAALRSKDIKQIETHIVSAANNMRTNLLLIGMCCLVIDRESLYRDASCRSYLEYSVKLFEKLKFPPQTLSDAKNIMAAYVDHYKELSKHGFTLGRNAHKLRFLERALENHADADEVYKRAANSTFREFADWARGGDEEEVPLSKIRVAGNKIFVGKTLAVTLAEELDPKTKAYFANINAEAGRALEAGEVILPVRLYDMEELRRFERAADKLKKELRINHKGRR